MYLPLGLVSKTVKWSFLTPASVLLEPPGADSVHCAPAQDCWPCAHLAVGAAGLLYTSSRGRSTEAAAQPSLPHLRLPGSHEQHPLPASSAPLS